MPYTFFTRTEAIGKKKVTFSTNGAGIIRHTIRKHKNQPTNQRKNLNLNFTAYTKINLQCIRGLNVKYKATKC